VLPGYVDTHYHTQWLVTDVHSSQVWQYLTNLAFGVTLAHDVQTATTDILTYQDLVEAGRMIGPRISHTGPGVFSRANVRNLDHARDILRRYREHYRVNTFKMYMTGNREQRQWLIKAARELELMPTVEAGLQYKLNITQVMDGYAGLEHSLPIYPLFGDVLELFRTTQVTYNPTLLVSYGGPWAENYFFATEDVFGDARTRHFTPFEELDSKASRRGSGGRPDGSTATSTSLTVTPSSCVTWSRREGGRVWEPMGSSMAWGTTGSSGPCSPEGSRSMMPCGWPPSSGPSPLASGGSGEPRARQARRSRDPRCRSARGYPEHRGRAPRDEEWAALRGVISQ
jgi:hypothetical protein